MTFFWNNYEKKTNHGQRFHQYQQNKQWHLTLLNYLT